MGGDYAYDFSSNNELNYDNLTTKGKPIIVVPTILWPAADLQNIASNKKPF